MRSWANFSRCRTYRYALWRIWDESLPWVLIVGLNPSTADETKNDPTIRRCIGFAKDWAFGGVCVANLFAYRATYPEDLKAAEDPVGPSNSRWLSRLTREAGKVVVAWGNDGAYQQQGPRFLQKYPDAFCIRMNTSGHPAHPLYMKKGLSPVPVK